MIEKKDSGKINAAQFDGIPNKGNAVSIQNNTLCNFWADRHLWRRSHGKDSELQPECPGSPRGTSILGITVQIRN